MLTVLIVAIKMCNAINDGGMLFELLRIFLEDLLPDEEVRRIMPKILKIAFGGDLQNGRIETSDRKERRCYCSRL